MNKVTILKNFSAYIDELIYIAQELAVRFNDVRQHDVPDHILDSMTRAERYELARNLAVEFIEVYNHHDFRNSEIHDQDILLSKFLQEKYSNNQDEHEGDIILVLDTITNGIGYENGIKNSDIKYSRVYDSFPKGSIQFRNKLIHEWRDEKSNKDQVIYTSMIWDDHSKMYVVI